jgi:hypothetical protein
LAGVKAGDWIQKITKALGVNGSHLYF